MAAQNKVYQSVLCSMQHRAVWSARSSLSQFAACLWGLAGSAAAGVKTYAVAGFGSKLVQLRIIWSHVLAAVAAVHQQLHQHGRQLSQVIVARYNMYQLYIALFAGFRCVKPC